MFEYVSDYIVENTTKNVNYSYLVQNKTKCDFLEIEYTTDVELTLIKNLDYDDNVVFWKKNDYVVEFVYKNELIQYTPLFNVIRKGKHSDEYKELIIDVDVFEYISNEVYSSLDEEQQDEYDDLLEINLIKLDEANEFFNSLCIDFFILRDGKFCRIENKKKITTN